jgi:hypothetical protein
VDASTDTWFHFSMGGRHLSRRVLRELVFGSKDYARVCYRARPGQGREREEGDFVLTFGSLKTHKKAERLMRLGIQMNSLDRCVKRKKNNEERERARETTE